MKFNHNTVLKKEAVDLLVSNPSGVYIDATCGGGGHSEELLSRFPKATLICSDWHMEAIKETEERLSSFPNTIHYEFSSFAHLDRILKKLDIDFVDGILVDFGTSRYQIDHVEGFSFMKDTFLDMRMSKSHFTKTAYDVIMGYSEKKLADIFHFYGEERSSKKIAKYIVNERQKEKIKTTKRLVDVVLSSLNIQPNSFYKIHPATKVFQAIRIEVNQELDHIEELLRTAPTLLSPEGKLVCISFHSLEDRLVKHAFKDKKIWKYDKEIILPSAEEIKNNPRSRSAKMRVASRVDKSINID